MADAPFYTPGLKPTVRTAAPGEQLWQLRRASRVLTCELRDDSHRDAGIDVQVFEDGQLMFTQRVGRPAAARTVADILRDDFRRAGWSDEG